MKARRKGTTTEFEVEGIIMNGIGYVMEDVEVIPTVKKNVEELTMWHKAEDCLPNEGETVICKTKYTFGKREVYRYEVSDFINSRYWCENNQYVKVLEWKRIL